VSRLQGQDPAQEIYRQECIKTEMAIALTIAGSDSVGGAGLQADLKAFEAAGVHGCSVVTCVTSQNTRGVSGIMPVPTEHVAGQIKALLQDVELDAVKTGMLFSSSIIDTVASALRRSDAPMVVDPVLVSTTGSRLHEKGFVEALVKKLLPMATLVTPNVHEAEELCGVKVRDERTAKKAARALIDLGPDAVLVKGGHLKGPESVDYLATDGRVVKVTSPRVAVDVHGTGCALSSFIAANLASGMPLEDSVRRAKGMVFKAILMRETVGGGVPCVNPLAVLRIEAGKVDMLERLEEAAMELERTLVPELVPEVGTNIGFSTLGALEPDEVVALNGRIVRVGDEVRRLGCARFGASKHVARIVLAASSRDQGMRCGMNIKFNDDNLSACRRAGLSVATFDRAEEPKGVSSMTWGVLRAIDKARRVPDVIYDRGGHGKEPMIRLLGESPEEVVLKLRRIASKRKKG
jgi:hydroxymethylpyrimidine kinase/phosphomethylpyrimidine kinase